MDEKKYTKKITCCGDCPLNSGISSSPSDRTCLDGDFSIEEYLVKGIHPDCPLEDW